MQKTLALIIGLSCFAGSLWAADNHFNRFRTDTQETLPMKVIDNGDGTFSEAVVAVGAGLASLDYSYQAKLSTFSPNSFTFNGIGTSWAFEVRGGSATFTVNSGSTTVCYDGSPVSSQFFLPVTNPVINLTFLGAGATAQMHIDGGI